MLPSRSSGTAPACSGARTRFPNLRGCATALDAVRILDHQDWGLNGLQFCSGRDCVELFNALDELGIREAPEPDPETVRVEV